jgi:hypothetical protein
MWKGLCEDEAAPTPMLEGIQEHCATSLRSDCTRTGSVPSDGLSRDNWRSMELGIVLVADAGPRCGGQERRGSMGSAGMGRCLGRRRWHRQALDGQFVN